VKRLKPLDLVTLAAACAPWALSAYNRRMTSGVPIETVLNYRVAQAARTVAEKSGRVAIGAENRYWRSVKNG
jgi:hypothetical protein